MEQPPDPPRPLAESPQLAQDIEYYLHKPRLLQLEEHRRGIYVSLLAKPNLHGNNDTCFPLMEKAMEFLADHDHYQVFLLLGDSGAGKSTFCRELEHTLWENYSKGGPIPLYIDLSYIDDPSQELIEKQLEHLSFSSEKIQEMKVHRKFVLICDGYDEGQLKINLYSENRFNQPGQWKVKMVVSCRSQYLGDKYHLSFQPQPTTHSLQEAVIAPFSRGQIRQYVEEYVKGWHTIGLPQDQPAWTVEEYMDKLINIPSLMDLVSNPFLLNLALDSLPSVVASEKDLSMIRITRVQLYDKFTERWFNVNCARLRQIPLSETELEDLNLLTDDNFLYHGIKFQKDLSTAIFMVHKGNPVVKYIPDRDKNTWMEEFCAAEGQTKLLRETSTVMQSGASFHFLHRSLLEYFYSITIYDPHDYDTYTDSNDRQPNCDPRTSLAQMSIVNEPSIIQFLAERVQQDGSFQQQLLETIEESKTETSITFAATNSITILVKAKVFFNGADLRGIKIPGADLSNGQFDSAQFKGADLRGVNLSKSWLRQADMSNAQMEDVRFGELPYFNMDNKVCSCNYSPNGSMLGVALKNGTIHIYETSTWQQLHRLDGHVNQIHSIVFSPDSQKLVSGGYDKKVRLWDTTSGNEPSTMEGHKRAIRSVTISPCGKQIASASDDDMVRLWDARTKETLFVLKGHTSSVICVKYSPDGSQLISGSVDGTIWFWDPLTGEPKTDILNLPFNDLSCVAYSPDGKWIATGHLRGHLQLWDAATLKPDLVLSGNTVGISGVDFSSDGKWIASSKGDKTVSLWDASTMTIATVLSGHSSYVNCVAFSPDGRQIASGGKDEILRLWEVGSSWSSLDEREGSRVKNLTHSRDGRSILSYEGRRIFRRWDAATGSSALIRHEVSKSEIRWSVVHALGLNEDGSRIAFGYEDGSIRSWNCQTGTRKSVLRKPIPTGSPMGINMLAYSPCCRWIVSVDKSSIIRLWDMRNVKVQPLLVNVGRTWKRAIRAVAFSSTGCRFVIGDEWKNIYLLDTQSTKECLKQIMSRGDILQLVFSPNDQQIAIGTTEGIHLWSLESNEPSTALEGHKNSTSCIAYSASGEWIAAAIANKVALWHRQSAGEVESWSRVHFICGFFGYVENLAWNPAVSMELVTSASDGSVQAWKMSIGESGEVVIQMIWGSNLGTLCSEDAIFTNAIGLTSTHQQLLVQQGAICSLDEPTSPHY